MFLQKKEEGFITFEKETRRFYKKKEEGLKGNLRFQGRALKVRSA